MKRLMCLFSAVLMGFVFAQDVSRLHTQPQLAKLKETSYYPATQNGVPVKIRYTLPIVFK